MARKYNPQAIDAALRKIEEDAEDESYADMRKPAGGGMTISIGMAPAAAEPDGDEDDDEMEAYQRKMAGFGG